MSQGDSAIYNVSILDPGPDSHAIAWDCDSDGFDDGTGPSVTCAFPTAGVTTVSVQVSDGTDDVTSSIEVTVGGSTGNEPPTITASIDPSTDEGGSVTVSGTITDPDAGDSFTVVIDWGAGQGSDTLTFPAGSTSYSASHVYTDDDPSGTPADTYTVAVTVTDSSGGTTSANTDVVVYNIAPTLSLDTSGAITLPGGGTALTAQVGIERLHQASATDPGADDLTFDWSFGPSATYLSDGSIPTSASDTAGVTFAVPGIYTIGAVVTDDDGGSDSASIPEIVVDDCDCTRSQGFWKRQFSGKKNQQIDNESLEIYLDIVSYASSVFDEALPLSGIADANNIFKPAKSNNAGGTGSGNGQSKGAGSKDATNPSATGSRKKKGGDSSEGSKKSKKDRKKGKSGGDSDSGTKSSGKGQKKGKGGGSKSGSGSNSDTRSGGGNNHDKKRQNALAQTLAAWLNFAKGGVGWDEMVDTTGNRVPDTAFGDVITEVESILNNGSSTANDYKRAKNLAESVNLHDQNNPDCETGGGTGTGGGSGSASGSGTGSGKDGGTRSGTGSGTDSGSSTGTRTKDASDTGTGSKGSHSGTKDKPGKNKPGKDKQSKGGRRK